MRAITAVALITAALSGAWGATVTPGATEGACMDLAASTVTEYADAQGVVDGVPIYFSCTAGVGVAWTADDRGRPQETTVIEPESTESRSVTSDGPDISDFGCDIVDQWEVECNWKTYYQKWTESGGVPTLVWERSVSSRAIMHLQQLSHLTELRYTHDQGYEFDAMGDVILQRQQGLLAPTFENSSSFYGSGGTQVNSDVWVTRTTTDTGKYSMIYNMTSLYDASEGVYIPIFGDPTSPRFQCYDSSQFENCEYPNGQEAGVF